MKRGVLQLIGFVVILAVSIGSIQNPFTDDYIEAMKNEALIVGKQNDPLYEEIKEKASAYEVPPKDAVIDPVWKAIPGYNGLKVDVRASFKKMKEDGSFDESKLVFKEVPPKVHLKDLSPAPIYKGNPEKEMVAFMINVAWGNEYIPDMLQTFDKHDVSATFFLEGRWVKKNPDLAKMIVEQGHEIGNHSYSHPDMKTASTASVRRELSKTNDMIEATLGMKPKWFAPPSGSFRDEVVDIAAEMDMGTVLWSVDTIDWKKPAPQKIISRINQKAHPGAMILMHPTASSSLALEGMIKTLKQKEYRIGNVSTLLSEERVKQ